MDEDFSIDYLYDFEFRGEADYEITNVVNFGDLVDSVFRKSKEQYERRKDGKSPIYYEGNPTVYHAGDVVNLPYTPVEISTAEAVGLAWQAYITGGVPE